MRRRTPAVLLVLLLVALLGACSEDNKVGEDVDLSIGQQVDQQRLGATTTTAPPVATTAAGGGAGALGRNATTTAPPTTAAPTTTTAKPEAFFEIAINADNSGSSQFTPSTVAVARGVNVRWTNRDTVARSVEADNGAFKSPPIPPGGTFVWKAATSGTFNYSDGTRPYAVGRIDVR